MAKPSDHPLFARISHWINLINFLALIISGFLIHFPVQGVNMNLVRNIHFFFMYFLVINGVVRFYYAVFGKHKDWREFIPNKEDFKNLIPQLKYYLFIGKHPKISGKYNPMQKLAYFTLPIMAVIQAVTGFLLYWPTKFTGLINALGGLAAVRGFHYVMMWLFIAIIAVHIYLVFTEARSQFWLMFFGKADEPDDIPQEQVKGTDNVAL